MNHLLKRHNKEISADLHELQIQCFTFNTIQHHPTPKNKDVQTKTFASSNKTLRCSLARPLLLDRATWPCQVKECKIILGAKSANWLTN